MMRKIDKTKARLLKEAHEMATNLHKAGAIDITTMREFDALCLTETSTLSATQIKSIRKRAKVSQPVFARIINVSVSAIKQWERGERKPTGSSLKLLNLVKNKGIDAVL